MVALIVIAALDRNFAIGRGNALPWHLPDDLRHFRALTMGKPVLMGRKTAESLGRALPGRRNLVLTRSGRAPFADMEAADSLERAMDAVARRAQNELWVIGGSEVYALAMPFAARMHLTHLDLAIEQADAFFPPIDAAIWKVERLSQHPPGLRNAMAYEFIDYHRRGHAPGGDAQARAEPR